MKPNRQLPRTDRRNGRPIQKLEITTPAVRNPGVPVELEPGEVSGGGREVRKKVKLLGSSLIPRPSLAPVFDCLQYAKTEPEGLVNLTT